MWKGLCSVQTNSAAITYSCQSTGTSIALELTVRLTILLQQRLYSAASSAHQKQAVSIAIPTALLQARPSSQLLY